MWAVGDGETNKITVVGSGCLDHSRIAFALNKTTRMKVYRLHQEKATGIIIHNYVYITSFRVSLYCLTQIILISRHVTCRQAFMIPYDPLKSLPKFDL